MIILFFQEVQILKLQIFVESIENNFTEEQFLFTEFKIL